MLLEFAVENFKSFKDLQVLSLEANAEKENDPNVNRIVESIGGYKTVKTKAIFGANGSGKSNLISALAAMWKIIMYSLKDDSILENFITPFKKNTGIQEPSFFQLIFVHEKKKYRYGYEADSQKIHREWLYVKEFREVVLFEREYQQFIELNETSFKEGKIIKKGLKMFTSKTLIISVLDQLNEPISTIVKECINNKIVISPDLTQYKNEWYDHTLRYFEKDDSFKSWTKNLLIGIDESISDFEIIKEKTESGTEIKIPTIYRKVNNKKVSFTLKMEEAAGTKKIFDFSRILYRCLKDGDLFIVDEWDALLHPRLTRKIVELFHSPDSHPNAQLIFVTHDTNLLDSDLLRRDQVAFVEKSKNGTSEIYNLSDIKGVRVNDLFEKNYLKGNYGALPILNSIENLSING